MSTRVPLHSRKYPGLYAVVDAEDLPLVEGYRWNPQWCQGTRSFYARGRKEGSRFPVLMHRVILGADNRSIQVDHIRHGCNFGTLLNTRANIHLVSCRQNQMNARPQRGTSKFKGVCWSRRDKKWESKIKFRGKTIHLGLFVSEVEAAKAYDSKARELGWPEYGLNFPSEFD